ncbi:MAG: hypothetical protein AAGA08_03015 [Pseudomonadota bacterium]
MKSLGLNAIDRLRGFIETPSGAKIPTIVKLRASSHRSPYSHIGEIQIPHPWLDEFEEQSRAFYFCAESGEFFTQLNVLEAVADPDHGEAKLGRMILLREHQRHHA